MCAEAIWAYPHDMIPRCKVGLVSITVQCPRVGPLLMQRRGAANKFSQRLRFHTEHCTTIPSELWFNLTFTPVGIYTYNTSLVSSYILLNYIIKLLTDTLFITPMHDLLSMKWYESLFFKALLQVFPHCSLIKCDCSWIQMKCLSSSDSNWKPSTSFSTFLFLNLYHLSWFVNQEYLLPWFARVQIQASFFIIYVPCITLKCPSARNFDTSLW